MKKQFLSLVLLGAALALQAQDNKGGISEDMLKQIQQSYRNTASDKAIRNAVYEVRAVKVRTNDKASLDQGWEELYSHYIARLTPIVEELIRAREREHQKLDNLRNYKMEWDLCDKYDREHPADTQEKKQ